jgi:hypothetical protein
LSKEFLEQHNKLIKQVSETTNQLALGAIFYVTGEDLIRAAIKMIADLDEYNIVAVPTDKDLPEGSISDLTTLIKKDSK